LGLSVETVQGARNSALVEMGFYLASSASGHGLPRRKNRALPNTGSRTLRFVAVGVFVTVVKETEGSDLAASRR